MSLKDWPIQAAPLNKVAKISDAAPEPGRSLGNGARGSYQRSGNTPERRRAVHMRGSFLPDV